MRAFFCLSQRLIRAMSVWGNDEDLADDTRQPGAADVDVVRVSAVSAQVLPLAVTPMLLREVDDRPAFTVAELRQVYRAALGHDVSATNLQRVLVRRGLLESTGERREPGRTGGRPAALFRFRAPRLEVTDPFAVLKPPGGS